MRCLDVVLIQQRFISTIPSWRCSSLRSVEHRQNLHFEKGKIMQSKIHTDAHSRAVSPGQIGEVLGWHPVVIVIVPEPPLRSVLLWVLEQRGVPTHPEQVRLHVRLQHKILQIWFLPYRSFTLPDTVPETGTDKMCTEHNGHLDLSLYVSRMNTSVRFYTSYFSRTLVNMHCVKICRSYRSRWCSVWKGL